MEMVIGIIVFVIIALMVISRLFGRFTPDIFADGTQSRRTSFMGNLLWFMAFTDKRIKKSAKFARISDLDKFLKPTNKGLLIDGAEKRMSVKDSFSHIAIISRTGGGKTTSFIQPNLYSLDNSSIVLTDLSGKLFKSTSGHFKKKGYDIKVLNLANLKQSLTYNPLAHVSDYNSIREVAHILIHSFNQNPKDTFWNAGAEDILAILIQILMNAGREYLNLANLRYLLNNFGKDGAGIQELIFKYAEGHIFDEFKGFLSNEQKIKQIFLSSARTSLNGIGDPDLARLTATDTINFRDLRKRKTILYLIVPQSKMDFYKFILNLFYTQIFHFCSSDGEDIKMPIYFLLDEFGHLKIPHFPSIITTVRQYNVSMTLILQSTSQLDANYGENDAYTILNGGVASKLFYSGADLKTLEYLERILGKVKYRSLTKEGALFYREENLMNADQIRTIPTDKAIFINTNREPMILDSIPYYKNRKFEKLSNLPPAELNYFDPLQSVQYIPLD